MIQKLRKKFILINMVLVSLVLLIVFTSLFFSSSQRLQRESYDAMHRILGRDANIPPPKFEIGGQRPERPFPYILVFCVVLDTDHQFLSVFGENVAISNETVSQAVEWALTSDGSTGVLSELDLRFLRRETPDGTRIAFADRRHEKDTLASLFLTSLLVGTGGLSAFFLISLFLSGWVLKPVEKTWKQQRQFVADASHELKTPLTVILANTGILLSHRQETIQQQIKWVENTQTEGNRMKKLIDSLLFLAKADDCQTPMLHTPFDFSDTVWSTILSFEPIAYEKGITLNSHITPHISLVGDGDQLKQLVAILLDNGCKYAGEKGTITISLELLQDKVRLAVNNTGVPIPPEHLENLFDRFYRVDKSRSSEQGGYGLGLAIAKKIIENHQGRIVVESNELKGTTFSVFLKTNKLL